MILGSCYYIRQVAARCNGARRDRLGLIPLNALYFVVGDYVTYRTDSLLIILNCTWTTVILPGVTHSDTKKGRESCVYAQSSYSSSVVMCLKKVYPVMFDNNFGKCGPSFIILSPIDS